MRIIEVIPLDNGSHRNQTGNFKKIPKGWAVVPDDMVVENFPFGNVTTKKIKGVQTVTSWEALPLPEVEEVNTPSIEERLSKLESIVEKIVERFNIS